VNNGTHTANINLQGQYATDNFHVAADATNGTMVSYVLTGVTPPEQNHCTHPVKAADRSVDMVAGAIRALCGNLFFGCALPIPGQQLLDPLGGMIWQTREHVGEPGLRIDIVELAALN